MRLSIYLLEKILEEVEWKFIRIICESIGKPWFQGFLW